MNNELKRREYAAATDNKFTALRVEQNDDDYLWMQNGHLKSNVTKKAEENLG